jgi:hypothetical protein
LFNKSTVGTLKSAVYIEVFATLHACADMAHIALIQISKNNILGFWKRGIFWGIKPKSKNGN